MATYFEKPSNPEFTDQVERFETTETGHADTFNKRVEQLFHNELALRKAIEGVYQQASGYTDQAIADLIGGAPSTMDTLKEISDAMDKYQDVVQALHEAIGSKANENEFESHRTNDNIHITTGEKEKIKEISADMDALKNKIASYFNMVTISNYLSGTNHAVINHRTERANYPLFNYTNRAAIIIFKCGNNFLIGYFDSLDNDAVPRAYIYRTYENITITMKKGSISDNSWGFDVNLHSPVSNSAYYAYFIIF